MSRTADHTYPKTFPQDLSPGDVIGLNAMKKGKELRTEIVVAVVQGKKGYEFRRANPLNPLNFGHFLTYPDDLEEGVKYRPITRLGLGKEKFDKKTCRRVRQAIYGK